MGPRKKPKIDKTPPLPGPSGNMTKSSSSDHLYHRKEDLSGDKEFETHAAAKHVPVQVSQLDPECEVGQLRMESANTTTVSGLDHTYSSHHLSNDHDYCGSTSKGMFDTLFSVHVELAIRKRNLLASR